MSAPDEILAFSCTRDLWQQDAIRRLFTLADFTESDLKDALAMLKAQYGLQERAALRHVGSRVPRKGEVVLYGPAGRGSVS